MNQSISFADLALWASIAAQRTSSASAGVLNAQAEALRIAAEMEIELRAALSVVNVIAEIGPPLVVAEITNSGMKERIPLLLARIKGETP